MVVFCIQAMNHIAKNMPIEGLIVRAIYTPK